MHCDGVSVSGVVVAVGGERLSGRGVAGSLYQILSGLECVKVLDNGCIVQKTKCGECANVPVIKDVCSQQKA